MLYELDPENPGFPDPRESEPDGLLAMGGDLSFLRLVNAYALGIFPWYNPGDPILWWSLDPRMILRPSDFHCSKSLRRTLDSKRFEVRVDTAFEEVIRACGRVSRPGQDGTWIVPEMIDAYMMLHQQGLAHSFETYQDGKLVGGLYGVSLGDFFSGESMFHIVTDASKVAFARLVDFCALHHFRFIDAQQPTNHLASLGAKPTDREWFLQSLEEVDYETTIRGVWPSNSVALLLGGNQGDRVQLLMQAAGMIGKRIGLVTRSSSLYETEPWGFQAEQNFLNQALIVDTDLDPYDVLRQTLAIEAELGRVRDGNAVGYASRTIDIDLIFYNSEIISTPELREMNQPELTLPHPRMHMRRFVLTPLAEIAPEYIHPRLHKTVRQLLDECTDPMAVKDFFA